MTGAIDGSNAPTAAREPQPLRAVHTPNFAALARWAALDLRVGGRSNIVILDLEEMKNLLLISPCPCRIVKTGAERGQA
jgi:hypothetical protein